MQAWAGHGGVKLRQRKSSEPLWVSVLGGEPSRAGLQGLEKGLLSPGKEDLEGLRTKGPLVSCLTTRLTELTRELSD